VGDASASNDVFIALFFDSAEYRTSVERVKKVVSHERVVLCRSSIVAFLHECNIATRLLVLINFSVSSYNLHEFQ
jgi:hypothetical protein